MSFFTKLRDFVAAPVKSFIAFDPILHKVTTGHFRGGITGYKERVAAGVHELYSQDRLLQKLGVKETSIVKVAVVAGYVVAIYFTAGAASGALSGGGGAAGTAGGVTAGEVGQGISAAMALDKANRQRKAQDEAKAQAALAEQQAVTATRQAAAIEQANALKKPVAPVVGWMTIAAIAALLL